MAPPIMLLCVAGLGLAAILYYLYYQEEDENCDRNSMATGHASPHRAYPRDEQIRRRRVLNTDDCWFRLDKCSICQDIIKEGSVLTLLSCDHKFHSVCIKNWLEVSPAPPTCPNCRQTIAHSITAHR